MDGNQEGIGTLKLECPQMHSVGRLLKESPYQSVVYDPGAQVGDRRFWPDEADQPRFTAHCRHCDKSVGELTATLQDKHRQVIDSASETTQVATLSYV
ncbi:hypothetical protein [Mycobacterium conspicuum]|jgi:hypothetical protein|uniref:Uncharacterized protein n=1 Tax=Mycobacterium conspicuum TaxID=44010 RepID=A0A1X1TMS4_9MYCO|nr:hypothetical protein [Mycobacterium conspicuum]ORV45850.1 hypothetical protein AWC00_05270 [Mycobacterium conspicuum]BBZ38903.1 hypothetical protein MCNS_19660 [Mycobacterium conspicuum]